MPKTKILIISFLTLFGFLGFAQISQAGDYFSWDTRTDRYGKPAGIFDQTPFPITENTDSYAIKNDEYPDGKTFYLGTKYFVDGTNGNDTNDGLSISAAKKTIQAASAVAGDGNKTIIVRGGLYTLSTRIVTGVGIDDTHRWTITGYGQERPIIDGTTLSDRIIGGKRQLNAFATLQRLKVQNSKYEGLAFGALPKGDSNLNVIDIWIYNTTNDVPIQGDGNAHFDHVDNLYIYHTVSEHTYDHCIKVGDDSDNAIIEWGVAKECGYWQGIPNVTNGTACGFDFVSDSPQEQMNPVIRYSIAYDVLFSCVQMRRGNNYSIHHNEFYNCPNMDAVSGERSHLTNQANVIIHQTSYGKFYNNVVRSGPDGEGQADSFCTDCLAIGLGLQSNSPQESNFFNNIFYNIVQPLFIYGYTGDGLEQHYNIYNNTFYGNSNNYLVRAESNAIETGIDSVYFKNNIVYQKGQNTNSKAATFDPDIVRENNIYYAPFGSIGISILPSELNVNPMFVNEASNNFSLQNSSPAIDKGVPTQSYFDFIGTIRPQGSAWDIGAYEYVGASDVTPPSVPTGVTVI